jgi:hypothetical protein
MELMTKRLLRLVAVLVLAWCPVNAAIAEQRVALVIGNGAYVNATPLANPLNDANAVDALFRSIGFQVVNLRSNIGVLEFKRAVRDFLITAQNADIAAVYYAGHGIEVGGVNYLVPVDAKLARDYDVEDEAVSLDRIIWSLQSVKGLRLIIIDACRDNPFVAKMQQSVATRAVSMGLAKVEVESSDTVIAYAAKAGSYSIDGAGRNSPFTTALIKHLVEPGLDLRIALGRVRDQVMKDTHGLQEPFVYGSLGGSTVALVPGKEISDATPPAAAGANPEIQQNYGFAERVGTREAWESYLANHQAGFYPDLARAQLRKLNVQPPMPAARQGTAAEAETAGSARPPVPPALHGVERPPEPVREASAAVSQDQVCRDEAERLAKLRLNPRHEDLSAFEQDLACADLKAQVRRLRESLMPPIEAAAAPHRGGAISGPEPAVAATPEEIKTSAVRGAEQICAEEAELLARLRANPSPDAISDLQRQMRCERLRMQLLRLKESIGD